MYPEPIKQLITLLTKLPGIGPRQATRFAFFLFRQDDAYVKSLAFALENVKESVGFCRQCFRMMEQAGNPEQQFCGICRDPKRDQLLVAVVERDSDVQNIERTKDFHGVYHVLGGLISPLDPESPKRLHLRELYARIKTVLDQQKNSEIILATGATTEGDTTALYIEQILKPLQEQHQTKLKISHLARGLSLGSDLEYADEVTLKNALENRK